MHLNCLSVSVESFIYLLMLVTAKTYDSYMAGLLHEGKFNVRDLLEPAIFDSLPWAYVMCNWAQILIGDRHWSSQ